MPFWHSKDLMKVILEDQTPAMAQSRTCTNDYNYMQMSVLNTSLIKVNIKIPLQMQVHNAAIYVV